MIDQYHLRETIARYKQGVACFGADPDSFNWQSFTVLLAYGQNIETLYQQLFQPGWFKDGVRWSVSDATYPEYDVSLYLSPKGMPYFVNYGGHDTLVSTFMGLNQSRLNMAGWLHISAGRVDIEAAMTQAQKDWLAKNERVEKCGDRLHDWKMTVVSFGGDTKQPVSYPEAERFDVRPTEDFDRLYRRIAMAGDCNPYTDQPRATIEATSEGIAAVPFMQDSAQVSFVTALSTRS